jgi:hypothetical protein
VPVPAPVCVPDFEDKDERYKNRGAGTGPPTPPEIWSHGESGTGTHAGTGTKEGRESWTSF